MKSITVKFLIALSCLLITNISFGQKALRKKKANANTSLPYCEDAVASAKKANQIKADAECRTIYQCVPCQEKSSKAKTCKAVTVQPACASSAKVTDKEPMPNDASKAQPFEVVVMQTTCGDGKVSLDAMVVADGQAATDKKAQDAYDFEWDIDGKKVASTKEINCIKFKEVNLKVVKKDGGGVNTQYILANNMEPLPARGAPVPNIIAIYKKTGCFGQCPIYEVQLFEDGRMQWNGKMNVGTVGIKEAKLDKESIAEIARMAEKIKFFDMERKYPDYQVWNAPSTIIYLNMNGKEHQVEDILSAPAELKEFEKLFDDIIKKQGWRTSPDKKSKASKKASNNKG